jgi:hypothetical protein
VDLRKHGRILFLKENSSMAKHETLQQRHLRPLDQASADLTARGEREFFWRPEDLARHLHLAVGTIADWLSHGHITEADGWIKIGELDRFISRVVKARIEAGLFGKGLDGNECLAQPSGSHLTPPNIVQLTCSHGGQLRRLWRSS